VRVPAAEGFLQLVAIHSFLIIYNQWSECHLVSNGIRGRHWEYVAVVNSKKDSSEPSILYSTTDGRRLLLILSHVLLTGDVRSERDPMGYFKFAPGGYWLWRGAFPSH
jgi:hypothetical protein